MCQESFIQKRNYYNIRPRPLHPSLCFEGLQPPYPLSHRKRGRKYRLFFNISGALPRPQKNIQNKVPKWHLKAVTSLYFPGGVTGVSPVVRGAYKITAKRKLRPGERLLPTYIIQIVIFYYSYFTLRKSLFYFILIVNKNVLIFIFYNQ